MPITKLIKKDISARASRESGLRIEEVLMLLEGICDEYNGREIMNDDLYKLLILRIEEFKIKNNSIEKQDENNNNAHPYSLIFL